MKTTLLKSFARFVFAATVLATTLLTVQIAHSQSTLATWYDGPLANGGGAAPAPFTNNAGAIGLIIGPLMKGPGIGAVTTGDAYGGNTWTNAGLPDSEANSIANGLYVTYTVQAAAGYQVSFGTNYIFVHASGTGPHNSVLQYSTDGVNYTDISAFTIPSGTTSIVWTNILATNSALQNVTANTTNFFRIVNWGATGTAGTWYIYDPLPGSLLAEAAVLGTNDFVINGAMTAIEPLATWFCGPLLNAGGSPPAYFTNNTQAQQGVIVYPITKGPGIGASTSSDDYGGNSWTNAGLPDSEANSIANGLYVSYQLQAASNYTISFYTNYIFVHASSTGPHNSALQYSTDGLNYTDISTFTVPSGTTSIVWTNILSTNSALQNVPYGTTNFFRIVNWGATGTAGTWYIYDPLPGSLSAEAAVLGTNDFVIGGAVTALAGFSPIGSAPTNIVITPSDTVAAITPSNFTANAGQTVSFSAFAPGAIPTPSNFWYEITGGVTNLLSGVTSNVLTLSNVLAGNSASFFVAMTNSSGSATSGVFTFSVLDPAIDVEPSDASGVAYGTIQFAVTASGTRPLGYQWYYSDTNGDLIAAAASLGDGSLVSGATSNVLTLSNWQPGDLTNFVVVVTNVYGAVTSSVASLVVPYGFEEGTPAELPTTGGVLALWDFDGTQFTNTALNAVCWVDPVPFIGVGTASPVGSVLNPTTPVFSQNPPNSPYGNTTSAIDAANDTGYDPSQGGYAETPYGFEQPSPNYSWGTQCYPATNGLNKANGVQFNVSTVGAKNIKVAYDSRVSSTSSLYERLQYTTNGTTWVDYPESSTFGFGNSGSGDSGYYTFDYDLTGFPGVDNNPNFGFRVVTEWQDTATYFIGTTNTWVSVANVYTSGDYLPTYNYAAGTVSYDLVAVMGDAITNNNTPPVFGPLNLPTTNGLAYTNMVDTNTITINFTLSSAQMPASAITNFTETPLGMITGQSAGPGYPQETIPSTINPALSIANTGGNNFALTVSFGPGRFVQDPADAAPILITATDTNGETASTWFLLTASSIYPPPTNSLTSLHATNMLANSSLSIPFIAGSATEPYSSLTYTVASDNNTLIPAANIVIGGNTNTGNPTVTITPAANQVGNAVVSVTVNDNNPTESHSTTANIAFTVLPNTNTLAVDYFNYDGGSGKALDVVGAPYWTRLSGIFRQLTTGANDTVVLNQANTENLQAALLGGPYPTNSATILYASMTINASTLPITNGSSIAGFNDGSGNTADFEGTLIIATNGAAPGYYRLGIANEGGTANNAEMFPLDLAPNTTYFAIISLAVSNGFSTLWVSPTNQSSANVQDQSRINATNLYSMANFELRESSAVEGVVNVGHLIVGTNFTGVFYPPQANPDTFTVPENTASLLNPLPNDGGFGLSITAVSETDGNGTPTSNGTNITFVPAANFVGTATFDYTITDNLGESSNAVITVNVIVPTGPTESASITAEFLSGTNLIIEGTNNNVPNTSFRYEVLSTTNLALPLSDWTPIVTNPFNFDGTFDYTNPIVPGTPQQFIDVKAVP